MPQEATGATEVTAAPAAALR